MGDVEIARGTKLENIQKIAEKIGVNEEELETYGKYKAKISLKTYERLREKENGKLVLVTAINPTPLGEGKTTMAIGLADGLQEIGFISILCKCIIVCPLGFPVQVYCTIHREVLGKKVSEILSQ